MTYEIRSLTSADSAEVEAHLLRLSADDRYFRFCAAASDAFIQRYVRSVMNQDLSPSYGAFHEGRLVGFAHIAVIDSEKCELAFSIDAEHRGTGLARQLMAISIDWCRRNNLKRLCMSCLRQNKKMQALANLFGLGVTITYDEAYAELGIVQ